MIIHSTSQSTTASTEDWIKQIKDGIIYAYDLSDVVSQDVASTLEIEKNEWAIKVDPIKEW